MQLSECSVFVVFNNFQLTKGVPGGRLSVPSCVAHGLHSTASGRVGVVEGARPGGHGTDLLSLFLVLSCLSLFCSCSLCRLGTVCGGWDLSHGLACQHISGVRVLAGTVAKCDVTSIICLSTSCMTSFFLCSRAVQQSCCCRGVPTQQCWLPASSCTSITCSTPMPGSTSPFALFKMG